MEVTSMDSSPQGSSMSVLIETPMDFAFANTSFVPMSSGIASCSSFRESRKRKSCRDEYDVDSLDGCFEPTPMKLVRLEVNPEDVRKKDVLWTFQMGCCSQDNLECAFTDNCLLITVHRSDKRVERRCLPLSDYVDKDSISLCYDANNFLLIGFNYLSGFQLPCLS